MITAPRFDFIGDKKPFIFFNYPISLLDSNPVDLGDGFIIRTADSIEKETIHYFLTVHLEIAGGQTYHHMKLEEEQPKNGALYRHLSYEETKYTVIECPFAANGLPNLDGRIKMVFLLFYRNMYELFPVNYFKPLANENKITPNLLLPADTKQRQRILNSAELLHHIYNPPVISLTSKEITELQMLKDKIFLISTLGLKAEDYDFLEHSFNLYLQLTDVSITSRFRIISLFSVLEGLLIDDRSNISGKADFLKNRIDELINKSEKLKNIISDLELKGPDSNTVGTWLKIAYKYRNSIAHGFKSDWNTELTMFKKQSNTIVPFIEDVIRYLWIYIFENPQEFYNWRNEKNNIAST